MPVPDRIRQDEVGQPHGEVALADGGLDLKVGQLVEDDLAGGDRPGIHHFSRDSPQYEVDPAGPCFGLHQLVQAHLELPAEHVQPRMAGRCGLVERVGDLTQADGCVDGTDVHRSPAERAVQVAESLRGRRAVQPDDEVEVCLSGPVVARCQACRS